MRPIKDIRRDNLAYLVKIRGGGQGGQSAVARVLGKDRNQIYQWLRPRSNKAHRGISDETARLIEHAFSLPEGAMDHDMTRSASPAAVCEDTASYAATQLVGKRVQVIGMAVIDAHGQIAKVVDDPDGNGFMGDVEDKDAYCLRIRGPGSTSLAKPGWYLLLAPNHAPQSGEDVIAKLVDGRYLAGNYVKHEGGEYLIRRPDGELAVLTDADVEYVHPVHGMLSPQRVGHD
jgi:hypothetical protein